jgi:hypothetical protein
VLVIITPVFQVNFSEPINLHFAETDEFIEPVILDNIGIDEIIALLLFKLLMPTTAKSQTYTL